MCDWVVDNKLSIRFGEDMTISILFGRKRRSKNFRQLNIRHKHKNIKQHSEVTCLGCMLHVTISSAPMVLKVLNKINGKLKFFIGKIDISQKRFAECSAMLFFSHIFIMRVQPGKSQWKNKNEIQIMQNKCIRFYLKLDKMHHISEKEFRLINWLPTSKRVDQCINTITCKFVNNTCPYYMNVIFEFARHCRIDTRNIFSKLRNIFRKTNMERKTSTHPCQVLGQKDGRACLSQLKKRIV